MRTVLCYQILLLGITLALPANSYRPATASRRNKRSSFFSTNSGHLVLADDSFDSFRPPISYDTSPIIESRPKRSQVDRILSIFGGTIYRPRPHHRQPNKWRPIVHPRPHLGLRHPVIHPKHPHKPIHLHKPIHHHEPIFKQHHAGPPDYHDLPEHSGHSEEHHHHHHFDKIPHDGPDQHGHHHENGNVIHDDHPHQYEDSGHHPHEESHNHHGDVDYHDGGSDGHYDSNPVSFHHVSHDLDLKPHDSGHGYQDSGILSNDYIDGHGPPDYSHDVHQNPHQFIEDYGHGHHNFIPDHNEGPSHHPGFIKGITNKNIYRDDVPFKVVTNEHDQIHPGLVPGGVKGLNPELISFISHKTRPYLYGH